MDTSNLKVGDWVGDENGWDTYPNLILEIIDEETLLVDEVFHRYLNPIRIKELKYWVLYNEELQQELYNKLSVESFCDDYKKFIRIRKLQDINNV